MLAPLIAMSGLWVNNGSLSLHVLYKMGTKFSEGGHYSPMDNVLGGQKYCDVMVYN